MKKAAVRAVAAAGLLGWIPWALQAQVPLSNSGPEGGCDPRVARVGPRAATLDCEQAQPAYALCGLAGQNRTLMLTSPPR